MEVWADFFAGCCGGIGSTVIGHPIETVKVRQQIHGRNLTIRQCVRQALEQEGATAFLKGLSAPVTTAALVNSVFFGCYGLSLKFIQNRKDNLSPNEIQQPDFGTVAICGSIAGAAQLTIACPVDLIKIKLQIQTQNEFSKSHNNFPKSTLFTNQTQYYKGPIHCLLLLYKQDGIKGWYRGLTSMFWRDCPSYGFYMYLYEFILRKTQSKLGQPWSTLLAGGVTGVATWVLVLPIDVVKSRIQADCVKNPKYHGMIHCIRISFKNDGPRVFFSGLYTIAIRAFIVNATTFLIYQNVLNSLTR